MITNFVEHFVRLNTTHSLVISSGLGGTTGCGPVTVSIVLPGVCFPFGAPPFPAAAAPFLPPPAGAVF